MKKNLSLVLIVLLAFSLTAKLSAAGKSDSNANSSSPSQTSKKNIRIFFEHCSNSWEVSYQWWYGAKKAAQELGITVNGGAADDDSPAKNIALIEQAIANKYDGIVSLSLVSDSYQVVYDKASAAGIPVFTYHMDAPDSKRIAYFGPNQESYAKNSAHFVADEMGKKGSVITIQGTPSDTESMIIDVFTKEINSYAPDIKVVAHVNNTIDAAQSYQKITAVLQANPDVRGSFSCTSRGGADFAKVCDELGIKIVSNVTMDPLSYNLDLLKQGKLTGIVDQGALTTGYNAVKACYQWLTNGKLDPPFHTGINYIPDVVVSTKNMAPYEEGINAALQLQKNNDNK